jgi:chorismate mutase
MNDELKRVRGDIDSIDGEILKLLAKRSRLVLKAGYLRRTTLGDLAPRNAEREMQMIADRHIVGREVGLRSEYVDRVFEAILQESEWLLAIPGMGEESAE